MTLVVNTLQEAYFHSFSRKGAFLRYSGHFNQKSNLFSFTSFSLFVLSLAQAITRVHVLLLAFSVGRRFIIVVKAAFYLGGEFCEDGRQSWIMLSHLINFATRNTNLKDCFPELFKEGQDFFGEKVEYLVEDSKNKTCVKHNSWLHHFQGHFRSDDVIMYIQNKVTAK